MFVCLCRRAEHVWRHQNMKIRVFALDSVQIFSNSNTLSLSDIIIIIITASWKVAIISEVIGYWLNSKDTDLQRLGELI